MMNIRAYLGMTAWLPALAIAVSGHLAVAHAQNQATIDSMREARTAINHAWDVYHRAALSGTLQSPALQVSIEKDLRTARAVLAEAEAEAADGAPVGRTPEWLDRIRVITDRIVTQSQWTKQ